MRAVRQLYVILDGNGKIMNLSDTHSVNPFMRYSLTVALCLDPARYRPAKRSGKPSYSGLYANIPAANRTPMPK